LLVWIVVAGALGFVCWSDVQRARQVAYISGIDAESAVVDPKSPTGYANGKRWLIVPEHNNASYQWIAETQQMLARGDWRVRRTDSANAPFGHEVRASSLYRWWLTLIAQCDHAWSGRPLGLSVEHTALWADPAMHVLLLLGTALFAARCFGRGTAALLALGLATLYPAASAFLPGVPDNHGLAQACALWSILPLLAGIARGAADRSRAAVARWFFLGGVVGGGGLWNNVTNELPVLFGIALGGLLAAWIAPRDAPASKGESTINPLPWREWALGGGAVCLTSYLVEYFSSQMDLHLQVNHPLHGIAWLGVGELLALVSTWRSSGGLAWTRRTVTALVLAVLALAALPIAIAVTHAGAPFAGDPMSARLTHLPNGPLARNFAVWLVRDGFNVPVLATSLPVLLLIPAAWPLFLRSIGGLRRAAIAIALGPVLVSFGAACSHLRWWSTFDVTLLALLVANVAVLPSLPSAVRRSAQAIGGIALACGLLALIPSRHGSERDAFTKFEVQGLIERALAHWIADRAGPAGAVVLSPPDQTPSLTFYGGFRGLGTPNWENRDGVAATLRIVTATTSDEAQALLAERGVTHLVLPSWDTELDEFVRWTLARPEDSLLNALHKWALPPWLRPVPYPVPKVAGFDNQSVTVLEVTDNTDRATALCWLTEAALESQQAELAAAASKALQVYPANLSALVARASVEKARGDETTFAKIFGSIESSVKAGLDRRLRWDRRVSLAVILAEGERPELARAQVARCIREVDAAKLRSLTTGSLYRLQVLAKAYALPIPDQSQRSLALSLLPPELRARF